MKNRAITLLSGGLDSMVATLLAAQEYDIGLALTFNYGQRAKHAEIAAANKFSKAYQIEHQVVDLPWLSNISHSALNDQQVDLPKYKIEELDHDPKKEDQSARQVWVPNRNALFINIAASFAEANNYQYIVTGFNLEEAGTFPDNSFKFVQAQNQLLKYSTLSCVQVITPVQNMKKTQMVKHAEKLGLDWSLFWSCYMSEAKMCGECESCARTMRAFQENGMCHLIKDRFKSDH